MPTEIGSVTGCFQYPVKSLQGRAVDALEIGPGGVVGDRARALVDPDSGRLLAAKRTAALLLASATEAGIALPDATEVAFDDPDVDARLTAWLGRPVHLAGLEEASEGQAFEMTFDPPNDEAEYYEIPAAPGSFLDAAHVHLVTTATLEGCAQARPDLDWDVRRFRPNLLLAVDGPAFVEQEWVGRHVRVGDVELQVDQPTVRCAMPLRPQPGLERQPELFAAMSELNPTFPNHLGVYASVSSPGSVRVGDPVITHD